MLIGKIPTLRRELLPNLANIRQNIQSSYDPSEEPDEHMQTLLESLCILKNQFTENESAVNIIERELELVNEWIAESDPPTPKVDPRPFERGSLPEEKHGTRSIFDDIDD